MTNVNINGVSRPMTAEEQAEFDAQQTDWNSKSAERKLTAIKKIRQQKLETTDWMANSDVTMTDAWKTKRQSWRDIPQNNNTETEYDAILTRDADGNLTNTIWSDA
tara:strand:- start:44 stop:361 length:318 start_codon:yes stop_codon:yes gene_type:complete